jgi:hypothetical protein
MQNQIKTLFLLAFLLVTANVFAQRTSMRTEHSSGKDEWMMTTEENGRGLQVRLKGKAEFNDDYSDLKSLSPHGSLRVRDSRGAQARRIEIEADATGALKRTYWFGDHPHSFDAEAQQWMAALMLELVRQGGFDAERRVARLFSQGGADAVAKEIAQVKGDYGKSVYFRHLVKQPALEPAAVPRIVRQSASEISSAYEKRQVLSAVPSKFLSEAAVLSELIAAAGTIDSDYERGQIMAVFLQGATLTEAQLQAALQVIAGIDSDYEQAQALLRLANSQKVTAAALTQLFDAVKGIDSGYEQARVLLAFLKDNETDLVMMKRVIQSSAAISSDYEQARVLLRVAALGRNNEEIRKLLVEASRRIGSDYERGRVLSAATR